jgi:hypothetical protein
VKLRKWSGLLRLAALPLAFLLSAATSYQVSNGTNQDITEHSECRNVANNHASGNALFVPTNTSTEWGAFYSNPPSGVTATACGCTVTPGSQSFTTAGANSFVVPCHNTLTVQVWGAGGGGGGCDAQSRVASSTGGASRWDNSVIANGGSGVTTSTAGGTGGTASGGTTNTTGQTGSTGNNNGAKGGNGANGGAGGAAITVNGNGNPGTAPGGGGGGARRTSGYFGACETGGGGGGGYSTRTYNAGTYTVGASVPVTVGAGGPGGNGDNYDGGLGAVGRVTITWN